MVRLVCVGLLATGLVWCGAVAAQDAPGDSSSTALLVEGCRHLVAEFQAELKSELVAAMKAGDMPHSIGVCQITAPIAAARLSSLNGWSIRRTALRLRNPLNAPDDVEELALKKLSADSVREYTTWTTDSTGRQHFRYLSAIHLGAQCIGCHGDPDRFNAEVKVALGELYPLDEAVGFKPGELRGAFSVAIDWPQGRAVADSLRKATHSKGVPVENPPE